MKCLNIKNKEVKAALDEVAAVLGSEDAAYYVISENEGYAIDQAPNGEPSKLFSDLLSHYKGNREAAIKAKSKTFTEAFKTWFGESKVVDANGEPLIVYHNTFKNTNIEQFDQSKTRSGGFYFKTYADSNISNFILYSKDIPVFLSIKSPLIIDKKSGINGKDIISAKGYNKHLTDDNDGVIGYSNPRVSDKGNIQPDHIKTTGTDDGIELVALQPEQIKSIDNAGAFSTGTSNIYYAEIEQSEIRSDYMSVFSDLPTTVGGYYNSKDVVNRLRTLTKFNSRVSKVLDMVTAIPVRIILDPNLDGYMAYVQQDDAIHINPAKFNAHSIARNAETVAHELVHWYVANAYLEQATPQQKELAKLVDKAYAKYSKVYKGLKTTGLLYGLKDQQEFMAELLTNEQFYNLIMDTAIAYDQSLGLLNDLKRLLNRLSKYIVDKFGISMGYRPDVHIKEIQELESVLFDFISTYNDEMIGEVYDFTKNNQIQNEFFQRQLDGSAKMLGMQLNAFDSYGFDTPEELQRRLSNIRENLDTKLESRYSAIDIEDKAEKVRIKQAIKYQITNLRDNSIDTITNVVNILQDLKIDLQPIAHKVLSAYKDISNPLSNEELIGLERNFFGFYCPTLADIRGKLSDLDTYRNVIGPQNYDKLLADIDLCLKLLNGCAAHVKMMQVKNATDLLMQTGIAANSPTIYNYLAEENRDNTGFEISTLTRLLGAGDKINDEAIKSLYKIIQDAEDRINHKTFNKATKLMSLVKKAKNKQSVLFEVDDDGKPTGYIVRDKNYGKFHNNYKKELEAIKKDLGINPGELGLPENKDLRKEYNRRRNKWLSENCERKYTDEYYTMFEELSQEATDARELIQLKIRNLTDKVKNNEGIPEFERLSPEDWEQLNRFYIEKKQLTSEYDVFGELKQGIDLEIAQELKQLNEKLAKGMKLRTNEAKFEAVRAKKEASLSAKDYTLWYERNTRVEYADEFYELLAKIERAAYGQEYADKNDEKRAILNMFRDDKTGEVQKSLMPNITVNKINKLDRELRALRKKTKKAPKTEGSVLFEDIAKIVPTEGFHEAYKQAVLASQDDPMALEVFLMQHANQDSQGKYYPKSYYSKIVPKDEKYIKRVPSSSFSELSPESIFYNQKYDHTNTEEYYQPKNSAGYDNRKAFKKLTPELLELREALLQIMGESNDKLTNLTKTDKYKMPQISGSMYRFMKSNMGQLKGMSEFIKDSISTKGDDVGIHEKPKYAPDGTSLNFVPQYFVKDLENSSTITADLAGSVMMYYKMAENFKEKNAIRGDTEIIKSFLAQRKYIGSQRGKIGQTIDFFSQKRNQKEGKETNIYKFAEQFINENLYGVRTNSLTFSISEHNFNLLGKEINVKAREVNFTKILMGVKALGTLRNLGLSMWIAGTGFFTASHNHIVQAMVGRYYDWNDAVNATKALVYDMFKYGWRTVGNQNYKSKQMALMDYFETGGTVDSIYKDSNEYASLRTLAKHWAFGMYSMSDYLVKGTILNSVMYNYKKVNEEFICKEDYYNKYGKTESTKQAWKKYKSAYDSVEYVNGQIQVKDQNDKEAWEKARYIIGRTSQNLGASADGTLTALQKAQFTSNVFGSMAMMHRQYLPLALQEKWSMDLQWDYTSQRYREAVLKTPLRVFKLAKKDERNMSFLRKFIEHSKADAVTKANMKQLIIEGVLVLAVYPFLVAMLNDFADKNKKNLWINLLAYIMMRTSFEVGAPYNFIDIARTVKNPTPLFSMLDNWGSIISYPMEMLYNKIYDKKDSNKRIIRGAYKDRTPVEKAIIQATPAKAIIELWDLPSKRNYYEKQILGN